MCICNDSICINYIAGVPIVTTTSTQVPEGSSSVATSSSEPNKPQEEDTNNINNDSENEDENEQNRIIESMDADTVLVRQRRINFYGSNQPF